MATLPVRLVAKTFTRRVTNVANQLRDVVQTKKSKLVLEIHQ